MSVAADTRQAAATPERLELAARVAELRADGLIYDEIATVLGISRSYASCLATDPDGSKQLARRAHYQGTCKRCGEPTDGSNGRAKAPTLCHDCAPPANLGNIGYGPRQRATIAFLTQPRRFTEIRNHSGMTATTTASHLNKLVALGLITRISRGLYIAAERRAREPEAATPTEGTES